MNKSPDPFTRDLASAERVERTPAGRGDAVLAADRALKRELRTLAGDRMPDHVRDAVMRSTHPQRRSPWLLAAAAAVMIALAAAVVFQGPAPSPSGTSRGDLAELGLALTTLERAGRRAMVLAGREVTSSLRRPDLGLAELPYVDLVRRALGPVPDEPETPPQDEEES